MYKITSCSVENVFFSEIACSYWTCIIVFLPSIFVKLPFNICCLLLAPRKLKHYLVKYLMVRRLETDDCNIAKAGEILQYLHSQKVFHFNYCA